MAVGRLAADTTEGASPRRAIAAFGALAALPDLDLVGRGLFGIDDVGWIGHRGATHGLLFAVACAAVVGLAFHRDRRRGVLLALATLLAVGSHGVIDAMTQGGRGIMFLWPLSDARVHLGWRPFADAPAGIAFLSWRGLACALLDLAYAMPLLAWALLPGAARTATGRAVRAMGRVLVRAFVRESRAPGQAAVPR